MSGDIPRCGGVCKNGKPCTAVRKKENEFCGRHLPFPDDQECPICYEMVTRKESQVLKCKHIFHTSCIQRWLGDMNKNSCPTCRAVIKGRKRRVVQPQPQNQPVTRQEGRFLFMGETEEGALWAWVDDSGAMDQVILVN